MYVLSSVRLLLLFAAHSAVADDAVSVVVWFLHVYVLSFCCVHDACMYDPSPSHTSVKNTLRLTFFVDSLCAFDVTLDT